MIYTLPEFAKFREQDYLKNQYLLLVWFKMLAVGLGLVKVRDNEPKDDANNDDTIRRNSRNPHFVVGFPESRGT